MIELAVFDMAGTTVYDGNAVADSFRAALAAVKVHPDVQAINDVMGLHKPEAIRRLLTAARRETGAKLSFAPEEVDRIHTDFVERMVRYYATDPAIREIPGAGDVFARLRGAGIKVALNTGFNRQTVDTILRRLQWTDAIDASIASDEVPRGRPFPDMIQSLMARFSIHDPGRVAKIGDTPADLQEGQNAGCAFVIGVTSGSFTQKQLERFAYTHIVSSIVDAPDILIEETCRPRAV
jgi:phosphonatase-like hydrolase